MKLMPSEVAELAHQTGVSIADIELIAEMVGPNRSSIVMQARLLQLDRAGDTKSTGRKV